MIRIAVIIFLILSSVVLVRGAILSWQDPVLPALEIKADDKTTARVKSKRIVFYPRPSAPLPDVLDGYLFNAERMLAGESPEESEGPTEIDLLSIDMEKILYTGSIIIGDLRKGMLSYSIADSSVKKTAVASRRTTRRSPRRSDDDKTKRHIVVEQGRNFAGYKVVAVEPERIVFEQDGEKIEKFLYDPSKKRIIASSAPARPSVPPASVARQSARKALPPSLPSGRTVGQTAAGKQATSTVGASRRTSRPRVVTRRSRPVPPRE